MISSIRMSPPYFGSGDISPQARRETPSGVAHSGVAHSENATSTNHHPSLTVREEEESADGGRDFFYDRYVPKDRT